MILHAIGRFFVLPIRLVIVGRTVHNAGVLKAIPRYALPACQRPPPLISSTPHPATQRHAENDNEGESLIPIADPISQTSNMATTSNFKRAMPAGQRQAALAPLRNMQLIDSKAILPAGPLPTTGDRRALADLSRTHRHHSGLPPHFRHAQIRTHLETNAGDGLR